MDDRQLEIAAREYCRLYGIDPDQIVGHGADPSPVSGFVPDVMLYSPKWEIVAKSIKHHYMMNLAIDHAINSTVQKLTSP